MTVYAKHATPPKSTEYRKSNSLVQIKFEAKSQFEVGLQDITISEFSALVDLHKYK